MEDSVYKPENIYGKKGANHKTYRQNGGFDTKFLDT
jgi:hypothetical protein